MRPVVSMIDSMFDEIYLVGGAVRDLLLDKSTTDLDFATPEPVDIIKRTLESNQILDVHNEGEKFGTISASLGKYDIQITSFREEHYPDKSRKPIVKPVADIDSDLSRRDFSINAIALSRDELIDPYDGVNAIKNKQIIALGDPDLKFSDDPLRILRAFRFVSQFCFNIEESTLSSAIKHRSRLQSVSVERIGKELQKIIAGPYWDDALNELVTSRVLSEVLTRLDLTYNISEDDMLHDFSEFTADQLKDMSETERWIRLIRILNYGRKVAGVESIDIKTIGEKLLVASQVSKQKRDSILAKLDLPIVNKQENIEQENVESMRADGESQKAKNDPRWMINIATYYTIKGKEAIYASKYDLAKEMLKKAIDVSLENQQYILTVYSDLPVEKTEKMKGLSKWFRDRVRYYILADIFANKLYLKFSSSKKLSEYLVKHHQYGIISTNDLRTTVDHVIASTYKQASHNIALEPFVDFLSRADLSIDTDSLNRYKRDLIETQIRNKSIPPEEKAPLYLEKANLARAEKSFDEVGFEYYDPFVDYLYNMMVSTKTISDFNHYYDKFVETANKYLELSAKWRRLSNGRRNMHLTSASTLVHAIQICDNLDTRIILSERIVNDYTEGFDRRNAHRYQIYSDWFNLVRRLLDTNTNPDDVENLAKYIDSLHSVIYEDDDEGYLSQYRPDLVNKRDLIRDTRILLRLLSGYPDSMNHQVIDPVISSLIILVKNDAMDSDSIFTILRNHIAKIEKEADRIDKIEIPDKLLTRGNDMDEINSLLTGESEVLEYKTTWSLDVNAYRHTKLLTSNPDLKHEVIRNIAGMMNKKGGTLLIGIEDDGTVQGLEEGDYRIQPSKNHSKKLDNIMLNIKDEISNKLTKQVLARISISPLKYLYGESRRTIIKIEIPVASHGPVLCNDNGTETYYVRSGTSTTDVGLKAYGEALVDYRVNHI